MTTEKRSLLFQVECSDDHCERCQLCRDGGAGDARRRERTQECRLAEVNGFIHEKFDVMVGCTNEIAQLAEVLRFEFKDLRLPGESVSEQAIRLLRRQKERLDALDEDAVAIAINGGHL
jgi:hypothetical protein